MTMCYRWIFFLLVLTTATINTVSADELLGARPLGMGGAHRAVASSNDAIFLNPAGMSLFRRYTIEAHYLYTPELAPGGPNEHIGRVSVVDNQIQHFATGLAYTRVEREDAKKGNRYDLAFSTAITDNLLIGTDIKYINFDRAGKKDAVNAVTVDVGLLLRTSFGLSLGVAGYNLTNTADYLEHPVSMSVGAMYSPFRSLLVAFDWYINFQKPLDEVDPLGEKQTDYSYHFGLEYLLYSQLAVRGGYLIDQAQPGQKEQHWSAGFSYISQGFTIDFGYRGSIEHTSHRIFAVGLKLFM